jgi:hypothetical protein
MASLHPASKYRGPQARGYVVIWRDRMGKQRWATYPSLERARLAREDALNVERARRLEAPGLARERQDLIAHGSPKFAIRLNSDYQRLTRHDYVCAALAALLTAQGWKVIRERELRGGFRVDLHATRGEDSCIIEVGNLNRHAKSDTAYRRRTLERAADWFIHIPYDSPLFAVLSLGAVAAPLAPGPEVT